MTMGAIISSFVREEQDTQAVLAALGGNLGPPGRPMPHAVMTAIQQMLPQTLTTYPSGGIAGVALLASGIE
jgi:hypothetical protein